MDLMKRLSAQIMVIELIKWIYETLAYEGHTRHKKG
jgi:hypothetical protein